MESLAEPNAPWSGSNSFDMGWKRHAGHRSDQNAGPIIDSLRAAGALVWPIGRPCDLLVLSGGRLHLLDVDGVTKNRKRDKAQLDNFQLWRVVLVATPEQAIRAVGL
jgi:hypothetical protein